MNGKIADSTALGYACIFISTWMLSMVDAGWFSAPPHWMFTYALIFGGIAVPVAGILSFMNDNKIQGTLFFFLGALIFSYALSSFTAPSGGGPSVYSGWVEIMIAAVFFFIWLGGKNSGLWRNLFMLGLWVLFVVFAISDWTASAIILTISGYIGLITSLIAGYIAARELMGSGRPASAA